MMVYEDELGKYFNTCELRNLELGRRQKQGIIRIIANIYKTGNFYPFLGFPDFIAKNSVGL